MRRKSEPQQPQRELFQIDLEQLIDMSHPLVRLGQYIDWDSFAVTLGGSYHPTQGAPVISTRRRKRLGEAGVEQMLRATIEAGMKMKATRTLRTQLGRVLREIERQVEQPTGELQKLLETAHKIHAQQRHDKKKIYSVHELEVECISKGKAGKKYEYGNKVSVAVSSHGGWFVGSKSFTENPCDGHTLATQMKQVEKLLGKQVKEVHVDTGYRGHDYDGDAVIHVDKRRRGRTPQPLWRRMKHRAAVQPSIGHLKAEHRLERNRLKDAAGNAVNAVLAAAAMNFQKLLRDVPRSCMREIYAILSRLLSPWNCIDSRMTLQTA